LKDGKPDDVKRWVVRLRGTQGSLYDGEVFHLRFVFGTNYPFDPPEVVFVGPTPPVHPHIYSNGHICLSILYDSWSPALSVRSVCLSILSMLSSCTEKERPPDDYRYCLSSSGRSPKETKWVFHDDKV